MYLRPTESNLHFNKTPRWLPCTLHFENHWSDAVALELFWTVGLSRRSSQESIPSKPESLKVTSKASAFLKTPHMIPHMQPPLRSSGLEPAEKSSENPSSLLWLFIFHFIVFYFVDCPTADELPRPGMRSKPHLRPTLQLWQHLTL